MGVRVIRHLGARGINKDDSKLLAVLPFGATEDGRYMRLTGYASSKTSEDSIRAFECNWYVIALPWSVVLTHQSADFAGATTGLDSASEWDTLFRNTVFQFGTDGNEYYGGEGLQGNATEDVIPAPGEAPTSSGDKDEPLLSPSFGPLMVRRLMSREVLMRPMATSLEASAGKVRFVDSFTNTFPIRTGYQAGGVIMVGMVRYDVDAETNFNVELDATTRSGLMPLIGGDISRVSAIIRADTSQVGDQLRTIMFGGDNYIESTTMHGGEVTAFCKLWASVATPYSLQDRMG